MSDIPCEDKSSVKLFLTYSVYSRSVHSVLLAQSAQKNLVVGFCVFAGILIEYLLIEYMIYLH